jgi:hypothetical protein
MTSDIQIRLPIWRMMSAEKRLPIFPPFVAVSTGFHDVDSMEGTRVPDHVACGDQVELAQNAD